MDVSHEGLIRPGCFVGVLGVMAALRPPFRKGLAKPSKDVPVGGKPGHGHGVNAFDAENTALGARSGPRAGGAQKAGDF